MIMDQKKRLGLKSHNKPKSTHIICPSVFVLPCMWETIFCILSKTKYNIQAHIQDHSVNKHWWSSHLWVWNIASSPISRNPSKDKPHCPWQMAYNFLYLKHHMLSAKALYILSFEFFDLGDNVFGSTCALYCAFQKLLFSPPHTFITPTRCSQFPASSEHSLASLG